MHKPHVNTNLTQHPDQLAAKVLRPENRVTVKQVTGFWHNQAWAKYKACRERAEHTGGGDGDADIDLTRDSSDSSLDEGSDANVKKVVDLEVGAKRKRGVKTQWGYSNEVLDEFEQSKMFELIDNVCVPNFLSH